MKVKIHKHVILTTLAILFWNNLTSGTLIGKIKIGTKIANVVRMTMFWKTLHERTWWRLFHKCHSHYISYLRFYFYFTMSVHEGYSTNTSFALHFISSFLFLFYYERTDEGYSTNDLRFYFSTNTWHNLHIYFLWAYLMKVIPQTRH